jgi:hypothetical protein
VWGEDWGVGCYGCVLYGGLGNDYGWLWLFYCSFFGIGFGGVFGGVFLFGLFLFCFFCLFLCWLVGLEGL